ncbi:uncharacterized protein Bfra_001037 [Botrytis fragariae]|uniref:Cytochrome P450 monooxygenase n=1 Tax=Botrytis fragariae TaxID=1964551 RepID=A0A8H6ENG5_9HELO|nr:uncharacterized protein Bfra_001037 [Botrytis fragariae]KAF5878866.1 hypothetical protein Bfra_001037 [Botrytis fragariae]
MGTTRCLGINLAMKMMHKFFAEVFRRWNIVIVNMTRPWDSSKKTSLFASHLGQFKSMISQLNIWSAKLVS